MINKKEIIYITMKNKNRKDTFTFSKFTFSKLNFDIKS